MKRQDELRGQLAQMKAEAETQLTAGDLAGAKATVAGMDGIREQIGLLDKLDADFAGAAAAGTHQPAKAGTVSSFAAAARAGFRAASINKESTDADGGYIVPEDIVTRIRKYKEARFSLRSLVTSESVSRLEGARTFETKANQAAFSLVAEGGAISQMDTPTFERVAYKIDKYAGVFGVTSEVLADTDENLTGTLVSWIGNAGIATENKLILDLIKTKSATALTGLDDIKKAVNVTLGSAYAGAVQIVTNDDGLQYLDTLKDENGRYLLSPDPREPMQLRLMVGARAIPLTVVPNGILATASEKIPFIIGDLKEAVVLWDRQQLTIKASDVATVGTLNAFANDLTLYKGIMRLDCTFLDDDAVVYGQLTVSSGTAGTGGSDSGSQSQGN